MSTDNYTVHIPDDIIVAETTLRPVSITLCKCGSNSNDGLVIKKTSKNYHVVITTDNPDVKIHDGKEYISFLIMKREKINTLNFKYVDDVWYLNKVLA